MASTSGRDQPKRSRRVAPDLFSLDGRVALVTGATRNIGLQIAHTFAGAGAHVVMVARTGKELEERAAEVHAATGATVTFLACDVSDTDSIDGMLAELTGRVDRVDVLVNNAYSAATRTADVLEVTPEDWREVLTTNLLGPYQLTAAIARGMVKRGKGSIINMLSSAAFSARSRAMAYGASKAALWAVTQYLASNLAPAVRVNAIVPGLVTDETGGPDGDDLAARYLPHTPMGRVGRPQEIAPAALYLASDASAYTTGAMLPVTGGRY